MTKEPRGRVVQFRPRLAELHATLREIALADRRVYFGTHARDRMEERGISRLDALRVLQRGHIDGEVTPGEEPGEWKCKVVGHVRGSREIGVITILIEGDRLFVKTVEWEDL